MLDARQLQSHLQALDGADDTSKQRALQSLRQYDEKEWASVPAGVCQSLVKALKNQLLDNEKRQLAVKEAAIVLGNMGPRSKPALPQLVALLHESIPDSIREAAVTALGKMGKEARAAVDPIVQLLGNSRPALWAQAVRALGNIGWGDDKVRSVLLDLWLSLEHQSSKAHVATVLCKLHVASASLLGTITKNLMSSQDVGIRKAAAEALAWCDKDQTDVIPALLAASLSDMNDEVREMAQAGLDKLNLSPEQAAQLCSKQLAADSLYAEVALRKSGQVAVPALIDALHAGEVATREKAARTLSSLGELAAAAAPALTTALRDRDPDVRLAAAKALWNVTKTGEVVVRTLIDLLKESQVADSEDAEDRRRFLQTVMEAISRIQPPATEAAPALTALAKHKNRHIRESALRTLQKIAPAASKGASGRKA